jgi:hypothetical protein
MVSLVWALDQPHRDRILQMMFPQKRKLLSVLDTRNLVLGLDLRLLKISQAGQLTIELYQKKGPSYELLDTLALKGQREGHFNFHGQTTNLALDDIDEDHRLEILVPSFDGDLRAQLHVLKLDPNTRKLELYEKSP